MAKLENYKNAFISIEKLTGFCLNDLHPTGKQKAFVFKSILGISEKDAGILSEAIKIGLIENESFEREIDLYGRRFSVRMKISIFDSEAFVTTGWIIKRGEDFPRLTSCYIK